MFQELPKNAGRFKCTFTEEQELKLKEYVTELDKRAFGITRKQFARIVYDFAEAEKISHRFNNAKKEAGKDFITGFMEKHHFSCRKPEATSVARLMAFNKTNVEAFFHIYKQVREKFCFQPN